MSGELFAGEQFDTNLNQYYLRARYYDQNIGRFTRQDTWMGRNADPITLNKYLYANANPANMIDPSGHLSIGSLMAAVGNLARLTTNAVSRVGSFLRVGKVNGVRVNASLQTRIQLQRIVGQVKSRLPKDLGKGKPSKNGDGWRWNSKSHDVRVQKGNPKSQFPAQQKDYVKLVVDGKVIGRNGKPLPSGKVPEAHIPLSEWRTWSSWKSPL